MAYTNSNQIGEITEVTGVAKIIRTDGTEEQITLGTEVYQGDIIETADGGAVNIGFIDDSSFAVSNDARIAIDEFVFDPETEGGVQDFSVMKGVFMYTSGLIGRENPDQVEIETPVGSIGIRGTIIGGNINPDGDSSVSVLEGAIVVRNDAGEQLLSQQYETVTLTSRDVAPSDVQQLDAKGIADHYAGVKDVSASLFSSLNDQMQQEQTMEQVDNAPDSVDVVEEEAQAEEVVAEEAVAEDVEAKEEVLEEQQPEAETLEESIETIETLEKAPELKTIELKLNDTTKTAIKPAQKTSLQQQRESASDDLAVEDVQYIRPMEFELTLNGELKEANNGTAFSTVSPTLIGTIALSDGQSAVYEIFSDPNGYFSINSSTGELYFDGSHMRDYENGGHFNIGVRATDSETGRVLAQDVQIAVSNVDEVPEVLIALEDVYDVGNLANASDDQGILAKDIDGFRIAKLVINDPEGVNFSASDISFVGNIGGFATGDHFQIVDDGGDLYLELKSGFTINGVTGKINDGTNDLGTFLGTSITVTMNVGGGNHAITLRIGEVATVSGTSETLLSGNENLVIGDDADNIIRLNDDDFTFINGGDGFDTIILENTASPFEHNLSGDIYKDDLSSIENIKFADGDDSLKITLDSLIRMVKTSNHVVNGKHEIMISTDGSGTSINGVSIVENDGTTTTSLTSNGFNHNGQENRGGETYDIYTHDVHGTIAIEANISNAGGL